MGDEALFDAVYAAPDDDAPREALAAHLSDRGDPRGELITLQLESARRGKTPRATAARTKALLAAHQDVWLAPLGGALIKRSIRWERGFPVAGRLSLQKTRAAQEALSGRRSLATLRTLGLEPPNSVLPVEWLDRFLFETPLRGLRTLREMRRSLFAKMLALSSPFMIETLEIAPTGGGGPSGAVHEQELSRVLHDAFMNGSGLPRLKDLSFSLNHALGTAPETYAWLWESALGRRIETLRMNLSVHSVAKWRAALSQHAGEIALRRLVFFGRNDLVLERTDLGFTRLSGKLSPELYPKERLPVEAELRELEKVLTVEVDGRTES